MVELARPLLFFCEMNVKIRHARIRKSRSFPHDRCRVSRLARRREWPPLRAGRWRAARPGSREYYAWSYPRHDRAVTWKSPWWNPLQSRDGAGYRPAGSSIDEYAGTGYRGELRAR